MKFTAAILVALFGVSDAGRRGHPKVAHLAKDASKHQAHTQHTKHHEPAPVIPKSTTTETCPEDYCWENGLCVKKIDVPFLLVCPPGTTEDANGDCVSFVPSRKTCPEGCSVIGNQCVCKNVIDADYICPVGTELDGEDCVIRFPIPPTCPSGYAMSGDGCQKIMPVIRGCPDEFEQQGALCVAAESVQFDLICPSGTVLEGNVCTMETEIMPVCPSGTTDMLDGCATFNPPIYTCPEGYDRNGDLCKSVLTVEPFKLCPNNGDIDDGCKVVLPAPYDPTCVEGDLVAERCMITTMSDVSYECPQDYSLAGTTCAKDVPFDCSTTTYETVCEEAVVCDDEVTTNCVPVCDSVRVSSCMPVCDDAKKHGCVTKHASHHVRQLTKVKTPHAKHSQHSHVKHTYKIHHADPLPVCQSVPVLHEKMCSRSLTAQATPFCVEGVYKGGNKCEVVSYAAPEQKCTGDMVDGHCVMVERTVALMDCQSGYTLAGTRCVRTEVAELEEECPPETVDAPGCPTYVEKACPGGDCVTVHVQAPSDVCPVGYTRSHRMCERLVYADLLDRCPEGTVPLDEFTCVELIPLVAEERVKEVDAQVLCPEGFARNGSECYREESDEFIPVCPGDALPVDLFTCALVQPKQEVCPLGSCHEDGECWVTSNVKPLIVDTVVAAPVHHAVHKTVSHKTHTKTSHATHAKYHNKH